MSMHPDLEWLAENVSEWPSEPKANSHGIGWHGLRRDGGRPDFIRRVNPLSDEYSEAQWLQARRDLGLVMSESEEQDYAPEPDMVNKPPHYKQGGIECIDAIRAALTPEEFRGYCKGNALKYVWRELHKGGDESMQKAAWYINKATESSALRAGEVVG